MSVEVTDVLVLGTGVAGTTAALAVCEANGFCYRHTAGPASGQCTDKRVARAVGVDQFHRMSGFRERSISAFGHRQAQAASGDDHVGDLFGQ